MSQTASQIIDRLGGTVKVAEMCLCTKGAVSQWRVNGIPEARRMYLELACPNAFEAQKNSDAPSPAGAAENTQNPESREAA